MNALVVYDTRYGNTELVAYAIAKALQTRGAVRIERASDVTSGDLAGLDLLVLGCPTQTWQMTPATKALLNRLADQSLQGVAVACFDTRLDKPRWITGSASQRMNAQLRMLSAQFVAPPESFLVSDIEGPLLRHELDRAAVWAQDIAHTVFARQRMAEITAAAEPA